MPKGVGVRVPLLAPNISDLTSKTMQTNADKWLECRQNADKMQTNRKERYGKNRRMEFAGGRELKSVLQLEMFGVS